MQTVSQRELEGRLWEAANSLRGPVDPGDFKAYVFPLLFFKWISDTWDWEHAQAISDFGAEVTAEEETDYHRFDIPDGCHWSDLRTTTSNVGVKLRNILDALDVLFRRLLDHGPVGHVVGHYERAAVAQLLSTWRAIRTSVRARRGACRLVPSKRPIFRRDAVTSGARAGCAAASAPAGQSYVSARRMKPSNIGTVKAKSPWRGV